MKIKVKCHFKLNVVLNLFQDLMFKRFRNKFGMTFGWGFTLAEVLITLTIIGVIAAITIPNLMQSWRRHERVAQVKTAYSILQNAVKMSIAENGSPDGWAFGVNGSKDIAERYILPYLKVQHICGRAGNETGLRSDCFIDDGANGTWYYLNGNKASEGTYTSSYYYNVKLQNGMDFAVYAPTRAQHNNLDLNVFFFVFDVNGSRGATKAGDDVFVFGLDINDGKVRTLGLDGGSGARNHINNQTNINQLLTSDLPYACNANSSVAWSGFSCARVLELNHWEFPDDYPIKKF